MPARYSAAAALLAALVAAAPAHAVVFNVNGTTNGPDGIIDLPNVNAPLNTNIFVNAGDTVILGINPSDTWGFNGFQISARGMYDYGWDWNWYVPDPVNVPGASVILSTTVVYGSVAWSLDGLAWGAAYTDTGTTGSFTTITNTVIPNYPIWTAGRTFTAPSSGTLRLAMWDSVTSDNTSGPGSDTTIAVNVTVIPGEGSTPTPEPASMLLLGAGLAGLGLARRRRA